MVHFSVPILALFALSASAAAVPTPDTTSAQPFTISQWIEDIIANPDGDHLSPEEAVAEVNAAVTATSPANPLVQRAAWCRDDFPNANANDAAACLKDLATKGARGQNCVVANGQLIITMCIIGNAQVIASRGSTNGDVSTNCNNVARTGGLIFDGCYRNDHTVSGSEICVDQPGFQVNIQGR